MIETYKQLKNDYYLYKDIVAKAAMLNGNRTNSRQMWKNFYRWRNSIKNNVNSISERMPWMTFEAIDLLKTKLDKNAKVFEYGGGGSTLFFIDRVAELVTVEHNQTWFEELKQEIGENKIWKGSYKTPQPISNFADLSFSNPDHFISGAESFSNLSFKDYVTHIDQFPDNYFDVISIDGRARPSCIKHAIPKLKKGGWLLLDNAERDYYNPAIELLKPDAFKSKLSLHSALIFCQWTTQTRIWEKY
jgi:hypothetical protein